MEETKKKVILIVDDEAELVSMMKDALQTDGFGVVSASNGDDGYNLAVHEKPQLILLDVCMPEVDGIAMLRKLREDAWGASAKVMLLTNNSDLETVRQSTELGVFDYIIKSDWKQSEIIKKIHQKLD